MILHLVTDRRRLAPGADDEAAARCLLDQARFAAAAGIDVIQFREADMEARPMIAMVSTLVALTRESRTRVIVNDRLDVALAAGADGVHLRGTSFAAARVRNCTPPGFVIGRSVRNASDAVAAGPVDYLIAGTVWPTVSKPGGQPLLGTSGLADIVRVSRVPVIGIGGIQPNRAAALARAGAAGAAAIGAWMAGDGGLCRAEPLRHVIRAFREGFDAANMEREPPLSDGH